MASKVVKAELVSWKRAVIQREANGWSVAQLGSNGTIPNTVRVFNSWSEASKFLEKVTTVGV
jgi:hypothetical protein